MFKESGSSPRSGKKDAEGKVAIRIDLQNPHHDEKMSGILVLPANGNLREVIYVEASQVSKVAEAIRKALFGDA